MPLMSKLSNRGWRAAASGAGMTAALIPVAGNTQQVANSVTPAAAVQPASRPIPQEQCNILFGVAVEKLNAAGELVTQIAKTGMRNFFVNASTGKIDCSGERQWPWVTERDTAFQTVVIARGSGAAKVNFIEEYGIRSAKRPTAVPSAPGPSSEARPAPRG